MQDPLSVVNKAKSLSFQKNGNIQPNMKKVGSLNRVRVDDNEGEEDESEGAPEEEGNEVVCNESTLEIIVLSFQKYNEEYFEALRTLSPAVVILYDVSLEIIRSIEVYQSEADITLKVYFCMHEDSLEEHR